MKKLVALFLSLALLLSMMSATALAEEEKTISIYNWGDSTDMALNEAAIARFNEKHPNVKVEVRYQEKSMSWADYITKLLAQIAAGDAPDICLMAIEGLYQLNSYDLLMSLNDFIANDEEVKAAMTDIHPSLLEGFTVNDNVLLFPAHWNGMNLFCNKDLFDEAGVELPSSDTTWDEFLEICKALTKGEGAEKQYAFDIYPAAIFFNLFTYANGCSTLIDGNNTSNMTDPKVVESWQFLHDLIWKHGVMPIPELGNYSAENFINRKIAMTVMGHVSCYEYQAAGMENVYVTTFPVQDKENGSQIFGADGYGILKTAEDPQLCFDLIMEFAGEQTQMEIAASGVSNPVRRSAANSESFLAYPQNAEVFYGMLDEGARILPAPINSADYENLLTRYYFEIMGQNERSIESYLEEADLELKDILAQ